MEAQQPSASSSSANGNNDRSLHGITLLGATGGGGGGGGGEGGGGERVDQFPRAPSDVSFTASEDGRVAAFLAESADLGTDDQAALNLFYRSESQDNVLLERENGGGGGGGGKEEGSGVGVLSKREKGDLTRGSSCSAQSHGENWWWTDRPNVSVRIRYEKEGVASEPAQTVVGMFEGIVKEHEDKIAMATKKMGEWRKWTYRSYYEESRAVAKALIELGLEPFDGVCILAFNSPEWHITNMAAIMAGGLPVGIYLTSSSEACFKIAHNSRASIIAVENESQLLKILQVREKLTNLKAIVCFSKFSEPDPMIMDWNSLVRLGQRMADLRLDERIGQLQPDKCATLIYTSGTSGNPKGVMLSHDNITWMCRRVMEYTGSVIGQEHIVSYLPLSHVASQLLDIYTAMVSAGTTWFAQHDALKGSLLQTVREVHPTIFLGVPRVWEKVAEGMQRVAMNTTGLKSKIASWAKSIGLKRNLDRQTKASKHNPLGFTLANWFFFRKVQQALGMDRCHFQMTGAAPMTQDTHDYFMSLNIPLHEIYGMSETTGPTTVTTEDHIRYQSAGRAFNGTEMKILDPDETGGGEIVIRGRHVFMGYINNAQATANAFTPDGYVKSGDVGYMDEQGYLFLTGRMKEIIISAAGDKVAPVPIEDAIKKELPIISNAMVIGDKQKYLCCLITLKVEVSEETGLPTNNLSSVAIAACQKVDSSSLTVTDIVDGAGDRKVLRMIQKGIDTINRKAYSKAHKIAKWSILERDFSVATGELTPTLKLKRDLVMSRYADCIESFYT